MLATKPEAWRHEKETRLIYHTSSENKTGELFDFPPEAKSIIVGEKITPVALDKIHAILAKIGHNIGIRTAKRSPNSYKVQVEYF